MSAHTHKGQKRASDHPQLKGAGNNLRFPARAVCSLNHWGSLLSNPNSTSFSIKLSDILKCKCHQVFSF